MAIDRVTITGADHSVAPQSLIDLSIQYPFVEWGILFSAVHEGSPRFPGRVWRERLQFDCRGLPVNLSLHLCGRRLRQLLTGRNELPVGLVEGFGRMQFNFHAEDVEYDVEPFCSALADLPIPQFIFQIDGNLGQQIIADVEACGRHSFDTAPLFDVSHGAGALPDKWPFAFDDGYTGYAGGLGPENLAEQIPRILEASDGVPRIWIDMETRVRSTDGLLFDLEKVEECLRIAEPYVTARAL